MGIVRQEPVWTRARSAYFAEVEHRFGGSGTRIPAKWNARRSAATFLGQFPPIGSQPAHEIQAVTSCSKSTILPVGRVGGVLCRPRRGGKRASTRVQSAASVSCAFSMPPVRSIGRPAPAGLAARGAGSGLAAGVQAGVGMLMSSPTCGSSGPGASVASSGASSRCDARRGAGGRRWRRPGWSRR